MLVFSWQLPTEVSPLIIGHIYAKQALKMYHLYAALTGQHDIASTPHPYPSTPTHPHPHTHHPIPALAVRQ